MAEKGNISKSDVDSIAENLMEKQQSYLEPGLAKIQQVGMENDEKVSAIKAELTSQAANVGTVTLRGEELKTKVESNSSALDNHKHAFRETEVEAGKYGG